MPKDVSTLHGSVPETSPVVLLIIDMINDLDFPEGEQVQRFAEPMSERLFHLKTRTRELGIPSIYVNDNFGRWRSDFNALIAHCIDDETRGKRIVERMKPDESDYFVLKPKHSGFYSTTLSVLLKSLEAKELILTGIAANICVLFTANDAYMRDYKLSIPGDCVVSNTKEETEYALKQMGDILKADTRPSNELIERLTDEQNKTQV
ncbi:MAG: cysteine hydrolase [Verrucomicrobiales bacterium]|nr:cysteine hydrolase [Verrucomicrobiales bacterium]